MTYKNRQANEGKAKGNVALTFMYSNIEHRTLITRLTQNKQAYNRCSAQRRTVKFVFLKHGSEPPTPQSQKACSGK